MKLENKESDTDSAQCNHTSLALAMVRASTTNELATAPPLLDRVRNALEIALGDVAAYRHELMLRSLKG